MAKKLFLIIFLISFSLGLCRAQTQDATSLRKELKALCKGFDGKVGIVVKAHGQTVSIDGGGRYPLMSLIKVPVAVAAIRYHEDSASGSIHEKCIRISAQWLREGTYSPLRDEIGQRDTTMSLADIIRYAVALSDNNMCDWLIDYAGGMSEVSRIWKKQLKLKHFRWTETEAAMNHDILRSYNNWATPSSVTTMLSTVFEGRGCISEEHRDFLRRIMEESPTGGNKLKAGLSAHLPFAHKTGLSGRLPDGTLIASTDAGIIRLTDGTDCYVTVLVKDTKKPAAAIDSLMVSIAQCVIK